MNATLPLSYHLNSETSSTVLQKLITLITSVLSLFTAQDNPAVLRYILCKNGETVD